MVRWCLWADAARALIALLGLDAGRTVSIDRLARGIWGDDPPERVRGSLQTYVSRLRRVLGEAAITTEATGYALRVPRENVDVLRFRDAVARARTSPAGDQEPTLLDEALTAWPGSPFEEELSDWIDRVERPRLIEEHLQVLERRLRLGIERGDHAPSALHLASLVEEHPLREILEQTGAVAEARRLSERGLASAERSGEGHLLGAMARLVAAR